VSSNSRENFFNKIFSKAELVSILLFIMLLIAVFNLEKILKESEKLEEKYTEILSANDSLKELNEKLIADNKTFKEIFDSEQRKKIDDEIDSAASESSEYSVTLPMTYDFGTHTWKRDSSPTAVRDTVNQMNTNTEPSATGVSAIAEKVIEEPILNQESFLAAAVILCNRQGRIRNEMIPLEFIISVNENGKATDVYLSDDNPELRGSNLRLSRLIRLALMKSKYKPALENENPVSMSFKLKRTYSQIFCT
tara:strand:+ start:1350 stop:2102 length:753 start_codon:yes stop_codon:yes gene_type:complete